MMSNSKHAAAPSDAVHLEKLIHDLEFENQQYVKEIEKEKQRLTASENKWTEHKTEADDIQKEIHKLDETTKNFHKQYTHNRDNIESLRKTIQVLAEHEEALQKDYESLHEKGLKEREEWTQTLNHYRTIWEDYKQVYEDNELAKKLKSEQINVKEKENTLNSLRVQSEDVKGKIDRIQSEHGAEDFIPYNNLNAFVIKLAETKLQNNQGEKALISTEKEKCELNAQMKILQKKLEAKREENRRVEEERRKAQELERKKTEERKRREEEERRVQELEEEKKRTQMEEIRIHAEKKKLETNSQLRNQAQPIQRSNRSVPTIAIPTFNYSNFRKTAGFNADGNTSNSDSQMKLSANNPQEQFKKQPVFLERPPLTCSPPVSVAAMSNSNLRLLRKVQESQLQRRVLDNSEPENSDGETHTESQQQSPSMSTPACTGGNLGDSFVLEANGNTPEATESSDVHLPPKSPGPENNLPVNCPKSPFDIEKHRERVALIQKSPEGFSFSKRDLCLFTADSQPPPANKPIFASPANPSTRSKQLSPTTKQLNTPNATMYSDGSGDGNRFPVVNEMDAMSMFGTPNDSEVLLNFGSGNDSKSPNDAITPQSSAGGNIFSLFEGGDMNEDSADTSGFNFNFGSADNDKSSPSGIFSMF